MMRAALRLTVIYDDAPDEPTENWLAALKALTEAAPPGLRATWSELRVPHKNPEAYVGFSDLAAFFRQEAKRGEIAANVVQYNARLVLWTLLQANLRRRFEVVCAECWLDWQDCPCGDRKTLLTDKWWHLNPTRTLGQSYWLISRESLQLFDPAWFPPDIPQLKRERTTSFLQSL